MRAISDDLARWLEGGGREVGEVSITPQADGCFELRHRLDADAADLAAHEGPAAARLLANFDEAGAFRPLKTAPNLRRGWTLRLADLTALRVALDYFYPAMLGVWSSHRHGSLTASHLRETLGRQTGMYRVTQLITDDAAQALIGRTCQSATGCLKHILWRMSPELPITTLPPEKLQPSADPRQLPLLCREACNLLVAHARTVVKGTPSE